MSITIQLSDKRGDAILVVKAESDTVEQAEAEFAAAAALTGLAGAYESFGISNPVAGIPAIAQLTRPQVADPWGQPPVAPYQAPQVPAAAAPAPAGGPGTPPVCQHGSKLYKTGTAKTGRQWQAWFCPAPGNDPSQCEKEWIR